VLYADRDRLKCRQCHGLRYASHADSVGDRAARAQCQIVRRLDPEATSADWPPKPRGMRWRTYRPKLRIIASTRS
jgi:hypothetical protein